MADSRADYYRVLENPKEAELNQGMSHLQADNEEDDDNDSDSTSDDESDLP